MALPSTDVPVDGVQMALFTKKNPFAVPVSTEVSPLPRSCRLVTLELLMSLRVTEPVTRRVRPVVVLVCEVVLSVVVVVPDEVRRLVTRLLRCPNLVAPSVVLPSLCADLVDPWVSLVSVCEDLVAPWVPLSPMWVILPPVWPILVPRCEALPEVSAPLVEICPLLVVPVPLTVAP